MPTGYELDNWKNLKRIADALEKIAEQLKREQDRRDEP